MTEMIQYTEMDDIIDDNIEGYKNLFFIENYLRKIISTTLDKSVKDWWEVLRSDSNLEYLTTECEKKYELEIRTKVYFFLPYLYYADLTHLTKIITFNPFWKYFNNFGSSSAPFKRKMEELRIIRNKVMHSKPIAKNELSTIISREQWIKDSYQELDMSLKGCVDPNEIIDLIKNEIQSHINNFQKSLTPTTVIYEEARNLFFWNSFNRDEKKITINIKYIDIYYNKLFSFISKIEKLPDLGKKMNFQSVLKEDDMYRYHTQIVEKLNL